MNREYAVAHFFITYHYWIYCSHLFSLGPANGFTPENPGMLIWSLITIKSPTFSLSWFNPPAAFVSIRYSTPSNFITRTGIDIYMYKTAKRRVICIKQTNETKNKLVLVILRVSYFTYLLNRISLIQMKSSLKN